MKKISYLFQILLKFIFCIFVLSFTILSVLKFTVLKKDYIQSKYSIYHYKKVEQHLKSEMKKSMISSGIDSSVIDTMFDYHDVENTTRQVLSNLYDSKYQEIDVSSIENKLKENIKLDLEKKNFTLKDENGYQKFVKSIMDIYKGEFILFGQINRIRNILLKVMKYFEPFYYVLAAILLFSSLILIISKKFLQFVPISLFFTCFLILFGIYYSDYYVGFQNITIVSETFSNILRKIILSTFDICKFVSLVLFLIGILLIFIRRDRKSKN